MLIDKKFSALYKKAYEAKVKLLNFVKEQVYMTNKILPLEQIEEGEPLRITMLGDSSYYCYQPTFDLVRATNDGNNITLEFHCVNGDDLFKDNSWVDIYNMPETGVYDLLPYIQWPKGATTKQHRPAEDDTAGNISAWCYII